MSITGLSLAAVLLTASTVAAHHTGAMFDRKKLSTYEGTVARFRWTNPHTYLDIDVKTPSGVTSYGFEAPNNGWLQNFGWTRSSLKPGDHVQVRAHPLRDGRPGGSLVDVILADGKKLSGGYGGGAHTRRGRRRPAECIPYGMPRLITTTNDSVDIVEAENRILIVAENNREFRRIWLDREQLPLEDVDLGYFGRSVGKWEGEYWW